MRAQGTKSKDVKGLLYNCDGTMMKTNVTVRVTSDAIGQSLSLTAADMIMIEVPLEPLKHLITLNEGVFK